MPPLSTGVAPVFECRRYICFGVEFSSSTICLFSFDNQPRGVNVRFQASADSDEFRAAVDLLKESMRSWGDIFKGYSWRGEYYFLTCPNCDEQKKVDSLVDAFREIYEIEVKENNPVDTFEKCEFFMEI